MHLLFKSTFIRHFKKISQFLQFLKLFICAIVYVYIPLWKEDHVFKYKNTEYENRVHSSFWSKFFSLGLLLCSEMVHSCCVHGCTERARRGSPLSFHRWIPAPSQGKVKQKATLEPTMRTIFTPRIIWRSHYSGGIFVIRLTLIAKMRQMIFNTTTAKMSL